MWVLKRFFILLVVACILFLGIFNATEKTTLSLGFKVYKEIPLPLLIVLFFLLGAIFQYFFSVAKELSLRAELRKTRRKENSLLEELKELRNLSIEEGFQDQDFEDAPYEEN
ncbi:MAG: LapA family protein [Candidatus Krumholzibacteria bacterium]|jgi:uncharacterized integral membrane protein|nr:LapA family protein [Candidatus Krumholzibacteria bacterium]MDP6668773.1 LapA family protein [Candidatus Krumholzibacteria bacterium]MDP6797173.1 LapA family protein [Candidatus Krumholzibacteria bacterium]MDP7020900.1 LapA family protein [Candidatus Krumholzibacteria bacterium]